MQKIFLILCFLSFASLTHGQRNISLKEKVEDFFVPKKLDHRKIKSSENHSRLVAASLDISLGLFGVHRLYLGTSPQVPVIYTFTLGGGGFLMLSDLGVILFSRDLEQFADNPKVIMWSEDTKKAQPND